MKTTQMASILTTHLRIVITISRYSNFSNLLALIIQLYILLSYLLTSRNMHNLSDKPFILSCEKNLLLTVHIDLIHDGFVICLGLPFFPPYLICTISNHFH